MMHKQIDIISMENAKKKLRDGYCESLWQSEIGNFDITEVPDNNTVCDTLIVGAGITGITTALMLQRAGQHCIIAEASVAGFGTTGGTSAHLNTFFDATYPELESDFGEDNSKLVAESGKEAMSTIRSLIDEYAIDCDFESKPGYLFSENAKETKQLMEILEASQRAGIEVAEVGDNGVPVAFDKVLCFTEQGQFHPVKYINALAVEYLKLGGVMIEGTFVKDAAYENDTYTVQAGNYTIIAKNLVYATHIPPGINLMNFTCAPYRSYVLGVKLKDNAYPKALIYDMQEPYHYFRTHQIQGEQYLVVGGEDHKTGHDDPEKVFENLENYVRQYFNVASIDFKWSSQYYIPADGLPYIGLLPMSQGRTYAATGFNGNGMMFGTLSGKIISDQILGIDNKYSTLFSPSRIKPIAGFTDFVKENADVAWHFIADRFSAEELDGLIGLGFGEGVVKEINGRKAAIYKDEYGEITALSPTCTHAGCTVKFNPEEKSWDCPCHGGRFDVHGKVISGPPRKDLKQIEV